MSNNEIEWADLSGYGLHLKTFYFKDVFGFNKETIGSINLLIDTVPVVRVDKAKAAGLICLIGQPSHNIYEDVDVNKPETLLASPDKKPPNLFQIPTQNNIVIEPAKFISQLGLPLGRYRKVSTTQAEVDRLFFSMAQPILNQIKLMLQAQFPYIKNEADIQIVSGPFGHYLVDEQQSIQNSGDIEVLQTGGNLKNSSSAENLSNRLIELYRHNPLSTADINNIIDFSCRKQPVFRSITVGSQELVEPVMPTNDYTASTEQLFYFSEFIKARWTTNIQKSFLEAALKDSYSKVQIDQQSKEVSNPDDFKPRGMVLPQSQDWLLDLCESDKNNPFHQQSVQTDLNSYKTPLFVAYQIARLLSVDGMHEPIDTKPSETPLLLDMTAGFGNLWPFLTNCSITAFENNSNTYQYLSSVSRLFNFLRRKHDFLPQIHDVVNADVLSTSLSSSAHGDELGYDYILATPDFAKTNNSVTLPFPDSKGAYHFEVKSDRLDHHVAILGLQHLKQNGRMVFLLDVEKPQAISRMESYFYQYIHTYFEVDLIVEMDAGLFYGSGHNGNVRMHVIGGKRDTPMDENEIVERTQAALDLSIPIVLNDRQLNNVVQHYVAGKYQIGRFDKLISNDTSIPLRVGANPDHKQINALFESSLNDVFYNMTSNQDGNGAFFKPLLFKQAVASDGTLANAKHIQKQINAFFKALIYSRKKEDEKEKIGMRLQPMRPMNFNQRVAIFIGALINPNNTAALSTANAEPLKTTTEQPIEDNNSANSSDNNVEVEGTETDLEQSKDADSKDIDAEKDTDSESKDVANEDKSTSDTIDESESAVDSPADSNESDSPLIEGDEDGIKGVHNRYADDDDFEEGDPDGEFNDPFDEDELSEDLDSMFDNVDQGFGQHPDAQDKEDENEKPIKAEGLGASLLSGMGGNSDNLDDEDIAAPLTEDDLMTEEAEMQPSSEQDDDEDDESTSVSSSITDTSDFANAYHEENKPDIDKQEPQNSNDSQSKDSQTKNSADSETNAIDSKDSAEPKEGEAGSTDKPDQESTAKKLQTLDAIENLRQENLARINMSRPQTLALIKQSSLTGKATGYVPRLIANTQLNLYQQVPKIANDLFSLTSNIDAWLYKTFNLNFNASQSIFAILPDFAKHAAAHYCTKLPNQHVIFDVSKRSQYLIAALIVLFRIKEMATTGRRYSLMIGCDSDVDFIELISAFEALASAIGIKYKKDNNPTKHFQALVSLLLTLTLGGSAYDIESILHIGATKDVISKADKNQTTNPDKPFLLLIGDNFINAAAAINTTKPLDGQAAFDHIIITSYDIFDIDALPNIPSESAANGVSAFLPYYLTDSATLLPETLLLDKRLFFYFYEVCLKKASHLGFIQYHYEPATYASLPVRSLAEPMQEGMSTLLDTFYHLSKHMSTLNAMSSKISAAPNCYYRTSEQLISECLAMTRLALNTASIRDIIADSYKNGKHSTVPVVTNYSYLLAEYLLYTNHRSSFIDYYQDQSINPSELLLSLTQARSYGDVLSESAEMVAAQKMLDKDDFLPINSTLHADQDLVPYGYKKVDSSQPDFPGYRCPNIKDLLEFMAKRVSMVAVHSANIEPTQMESAEVYGINTNGDTRVVLCDGSTLLKGNSEAAFIKRVDIVRKFVSMIPNNDISATPFESMVYELSRTGIDCQYVSPNAIKYVISSVTSNGIESVLRLNIERDRRNVFNFSDDVYSAKNDAVIIDMTLSYHPYIGIAPMRYNRHTDSVDHFRQRSIVVAEFLPPKSIKELVFKLSLPDPRMHKKAMVVTDYIDIDFVLTNFYGDFNETMILSAMKLAGCNTESSFSSSNHNHYLAMLDMLSMPQTINIGLHGNAAMQKVSHNDLIDHLYASIKKIAGIDGLGQKAALEVLFKYVKAYQPLHPNNHSWYQSLFYTNYELKAAPVYSGSVSSEAVYPTVFEYQHITEFTPSIPTLVVTARHFIREQFSTIESFVAAMSENAVSSYYASQTNDIYESFIAMSKPMQMAYIYSSEFKKQNIHAFKSMVFSEFRVNLDQTPNVLSAVSKIKNPNLDELYQNLLETNKLVVNSANFIASAINHKVEDNTDHFTLRNFEVDVAASNNNVDADAYFYGYNHTASNFRSNKRQLYAMALGLLLPVISFTESNQPRFALLLLRHLSYVVITNQHDRLIFLSKKDFSTAWIRLGDKNKLIVNCKSDELMPFYADVDGRELTDHERRKAESNCVSYSKAFTASDTDVSKSVFSIMDERDLISAVSGRNWAGLTGAYDVIRFSNNTNHYFIHIVEKTVSNI